MTLDFIGTHGYLMSTPIYALYLPETKLLEMSDQIFQVLEACNANAKVMDKLNATIESLCNNY
jgi:hypothetical protein